MTNELADMLRSVKIVVVQPQRCPHFILDVRHYREEDGSCKCNDPKEKIMKKWGYHWDRKAKQWR
jgi:hypothetical protein